MRGRTFVRALLITVVLCAGVIIRAQSAPQRGGSLPPVIPIFPLEIPMLFPEVSRPLYIFEPRYRAMVADALKGDRIIGMATLKPGYEANYAGRPPIYEIGCAGMISDVEELSDGRFNIVLRGLVKFRVTGEDESRAYRLARIEALPEAPDAGDKAALSRQRQRLEALITKGSGSTVPPGTTDEQLVNMLAQYLPMPHAQRQTLLELPNLLWRARALIEMIEAKPAVVAALPTEHTASRDEHTRTR
jgi:hypothetical protein